MTVMLVTEFEWDDGNLEHLAAHGLDANDVNAMLASRITAIRNKRAGSGDYKVIGRGKGGELLTVVVARTGVPGRWRPVTGRRSSDAERKIYER
jgi:uncharacterized DUF497 family protein